MKKRAMSRGFSLVELSIVLVILGLLTGGILAGQSLIRASELRSIPSDIDRYVTAALAFRDKYNALPGDMDNATQFWGSAGGNGGDTDCFNAAAAAPATCNGDGDRRVTRSQYADSATTREYYHYFRHLANAGMIEGSYTGVPGAGGVLDQIPGENIPQLRIASAGLGLGYTANPISTTNVDSYFGFYLSTFTIGGANSGSVPNVPIFTPAEVWNIDTKMDDGKPGYGRVLVQKPAALPGCATDPDANLATYSLSESGKTCFLQYRNVHGT